ncbi:hypothetical protein EIP86_004267 [Pleurotus ostreatoroseus]|nr:hypothetical protein EIP86_004267 [Pleurotus ostreatoroseus]
MFKRRPGMTREEFREYWGTNHARIFTSVNAVKEKIVRYNQFHMLGPQTDALAAAGLPIAPFDGAAEFWVEKVEDLLAVFGDEEFIKTAVPDEVNFMDRNSVQLLVGDDQVKHFKS